MSTQIAGLSYGGDSLYARYTYPIRRAVVPEVKPVVWTPKHRTSEECHEIMDGLKAGTWKSARWFVRNGLDRMVTIVKYRVNSNQVRIFYDGCTTDVYPYDLHEYSTQAIS